MLCLLASDNPQSGRPRNSGEGTCVPFWLLCLNWTGGGRRRWGDEWTDAPVVWRLPVPPARPRGLPRVWSWYSFWVFLHLLGVFGFLTAHGVVVGVSFALQKERDPGRIRTLLELSGSSMLAFYVSLLVLLGGGFAAVGYLHLW